MTIQKFAQLIKDDIARYRADCEFVSEADDDPTCRQCTANVFGSIERIIDKHLKEATNGH